KSFRQRRPAPKGGTWIWGLSAGDYMRMAPAKDWIAFRAEKFAGWPAGKERATLPAADLVLYRLPEVIIAIAEGRSIYVVEGEKDADNLAALGLVATTNPMGAGKWLQEFTETLHGADVVVIGDNDPAGRQHAEQVAAALHGVARRVRVL